MSSSEAMPMCGTGVERVVVIDLDADTDDEDLDDEHMDDSTGISLTPDSSTDEDMTYRLDRYLHTSGGCVDEDIDRWLNAEEVAGAEGEATVDSTTDDNEAFDERCVAMIEMYLKTDSLDTSSQRRQRTKLESKLIQKLSEMKNKLRQKTVRMRQLAQNNRRLKEEALKRRALPAAIDERKTTSSDVVKTICCVNCRSLVAVDQQFHSQRCDDNRCLRVRRSDCGPKALPLISTPKNSRSKSKKLTKN